MKYQSEIEFVIYMIKNAIAMDADSSKAIALFEKYKNCNWKVVDKLAKLNKVEALIFNYLKQLPQELKDRVPSYHSYEMKYKLALTRNINREEFLKKFRAVTQTSPVDYCLLKGSVSKYYYPDPTMRHMGDIDILYRNIPDNEAVILFNSLDYDLEESKPKEFVFKSRNLGLIVEFQNSLVDSSYRLWYRYLSNIWQRLIPTDVKGEYRMSDEDFFIYHIIHMAKHFINGGIGLRHIVDTYIIFSHFADKDFDMEYVILTLRELHIEKFYLKIMNLISYWFNSDNNVADKEILDLTRFISTTGAFGNKKQRYANQILLKKQNLIRRIFPGVATMKNYYGIDFSKNKLLILPYWAKLNSTRIKRGKKNIEDIHDVMNISNNKINYTKYIFNMCGLDDSLL